MGKSRTKYDRIKGERDEEVMQVALQQIVSNRLRIKDASVMFGIPKTTLYSRLQIVKKQLPESQEVSLMMGLKKKDMINKFASRQIFTMTQEKNLVAYLLAACKLNFGLTLQATRELAYQYAISVGQKVPESWEINKKAGQAWAYWFLKRHSEISLRKPEATSIARNSSFTRANVEIFFKNLEEIMKQHEFEPARIFNMDETGLSTVLQPPKVLADKKAKQVGKCVTTERGESITICAFVNAAGESIPPVYLFPRKKTHPEYMEGSLEGSIAFYNDRGYMDSPTFLKVLDHFKNHTFASTNNEILLILDNHASHLSLDAIKFCRDSGIHMLTLPPHTSHRTQPLDLSVFGPFKAYCASAFDSWISAGGGNRVNLRNIARLSAEPLRKSMTSKNIKAGFLKSGIYPLNSAKLLSSFEPTKYESTSTEVCRSVSGDNLGNISTSSFSTASTAIIPKIAFSHEATTQVRIPPEIINEESIPKFHHREEYAEYNEQDRFPQDFQEEVFPEPPHHREHNEKMIPVQSFVSQQESISFDDQILDLSTPRQEAYDCKMLTVGPKKIFPIADGPFDLSKSSNLNVVPQHSELTFGGLEVLRPLPAPPSKSNQSTRNKTMQSVIATGSPELQRKKQMAMRKRIKDEKKEINDQKKIQKKGTARGVKRTIMPDTELPVVPQKKRGRPRKVPLGEISK
ncbi:uncharacterized protein LOC129805249 [Phlebotomus papatasi]|uniref:uncharacterized protein LOC129804713 n=1 Tax=Phlebotomus papatasi TaxID=29031 RepID=UPI002483DE36|nr:uncharacterized protein LOC129804713 [Phlebotomus papatasi]XP_055709004.1 uncharacterized protein LOC129805249 [Phlebotomus papatasi]